MFYPFLLAFTWPFWAFLAISFLFLLVALEQEAFEVLVIGTLVMLVAVIGFSNLNVFHWIYENPLTVLVGVGCYLLAGVVWGLIKWYFFCLNKADNYATRRKDFADRFATYQKNNPTSKVTFPDFLSDNVYCNDFPPTPANNKARITAWMTYWPCSAVWTILNDPIRRFYNFVYNRLTNLYTRISNSVFSRFDEFKAS